MGLIYYCHYHPDKNSREIEHFSMKPHPYDYAGTGYFSDVIYHSRNENAQLYIVTMGYEEGWPAKRTKPRIIDRYHLHYIFKGSGECNGLPIHEGQILTVPFNTEYYIKSSSENPMTLGWIGISGRMSESIIDALHLPKEPIINIPLGHLEKIKHIFLETVYQTPTDIDIPYYLFKQFFHIMAISGIPSTTKSQTYSEYTRCAINYINSNFMENITVADVSKAAHVSESYLRVLFANDLGISPHDYICKKRISTAKDMLKQPYISISAIAESCGYSERSSFDKRFKKETGMTPNEYRKKNR